ncbi:MAG: transcriptional regulator [Candidatus Omnitrophica bacterium]|nr:transcriptional regulator [Candidatus Omnitrophota bacterium]
MVEEELQAINDVKDAAMSLREFNKIKFPAPKQYTRQDVVRIRAKLHVSQAVFAYLLNASQSTVKKWEIGVKRPGGSNCKLLQLLENKGVEVLLV